jgi:hypothetical protein
VVMILWKYYLSCIDDYHGLVTSRYVS